MKLNTVPFNSRTVFYFVIIFALSISGIIFPLFFQGDKEVKIWIQGISMTVAMLACIMLLREKYRTKASSYNGISIFFMVAILLAMTLVYFA